jgi:carboxymethylenebutenolidase
MAEVTEKAVEVTAPDGVADSVLLYPTAPGRYPAVLFWSDGAGLRPTMVDMARRLAAQGHVVLAPNPFYRTRRAPVWPAGFDFSKPEDMAQFVAAHRLMTPEAVEGAARACLAFLDAQPQTDTSRKAGVQGYCMGGALSFRTASALPERIGAVGSFHGGGLVTDDPASPHRIIPRTKASFLVAVAQDDDRKQPEAVGVLQAAFAEAGREAVVEVYPADHGWCPPDGRVYDGAQAERAWAELTALYARALT